MKICRSFLSLMGVVAWAYTASAEVPEMLTLAAARQEGLTANPRISVAQLRAKAARQVVTETRAGYFPMIALNATGVGVGETNTRIAAGSLSNSQIYDHIGIGANVNQLLTDFGHTGALVDAAKNRARAADSALLATRAQLLIEIDRAYFAALAAQAVKEVAARTLANRQLLFERIHALATNNLKSDFDARVAQVSADEAALLADDAEKNLRASLATLASLLGRRDLPTLSLKEEPVLDEELPKEIEPLVSLALRQRPELVQQRQAAEAEHNLAKAARDQRLPTVSALASVGVVPVHDSHLEHNYAVGGINVSLPIFTGGQYKARQNEVELLAKGADAALQDTENNVVRDVHLAWLEANHARERIKLTGHLLENSNAARDLAHARFDQGLTSLIELNQAELEQTGAEIAAANARYDYRIQRDILAYQTGSLN